MPTAGSSASNSYVNDSPGITDGCVNGGTPSIEFGTRIPCQWITVPTGSSLWSTTRTLSPTSTWISGAGTVPLYVHAWTILPGSTSQSTILAVTSNCL